MCDSQQYLGQVVYVNIDRPLGSKHPKHGFFYEVNYGYIPNTISGDGEELDAYVLGIEKPLKEFEGKCIAIIHRIDDNDDKLIIVPNDLYLSDIEIENKISFQEKWFQHKLIRLQPAICLMCGFLGFGKTTQAKKLELSMPAIRMTHDEFMLKRYGRNPDNFQQRYKEVDDFIRQETTEAIRNKKNVILDYGFWSKEKRRQYYDWAKSITPNVYFYAMRCDIRIAKKRVIKRNISNPDELLIDENSFNEFLKQYTPITMDEGYPVVFCSSDNYAENI